MNKEELDELQSLIDKFDDEHSEEFGKNNVSALRVTSSLVFAKRMTESPL